MLARVLTALALIPVVLAVVFCTSPWPVGIMLLVVLSRCFAEFSKLVRGSLPILGIAAIVPMTIRSVRGDELPYIHAGLTAVVWAVPMIYFLWMAARNSVTSECVWFVVPLAFLFILHVKTAPTDTLWNVRTWLLMPLVPLWIGDSAAIFAGKAFGKHLMAPTISPKKTWEGGIANFFGCILGAYLIGLWCQIPLGASLGCGAAMGVLGQIGDLYESALKRQAGVKDSGTLLPGHGGILDRIDSILMSAPVVVLILLYVRH